MIHRLTGFAMLLVLQPLTGCDAGCSNDVLTETSSPDGRYVAIVFQRDCGATTGFSTQVSVLPAGRRLRGGGNVFIADTDHGATPAGSHGGPVVQVRWRAADTLEVERDPRVRSFVAEKRRNGIQIVYTDRGT